MMQQEARCKHQVTAVLSISGRKIINFTHSKSKKGMREGKSLNKRGEGEGGRERERERKREREGGMGEVLGMKLTRLTCLVV